MGNLLIQVKQLQQVIKDKDKIILEKDKKISALIGINENNSQQLVEITNLNCVYQRTGIDFCGEALSK